MGSTIFFGLSLEILLKISYLAQFWKFLSEFLYVYTYQQVISSNNGSNMAPVGATESDMPWEVGLKIVISLVTEDGVFCHMICQVVVKVNS